jgi:uncharacterized protein YjiS (DUF1127 family)
MSTLELSYCRARRRASSFGAFLRRVSDLLLLWQERGRQRRQLESLSDRMLRDIGLTRADVLAESSKPFWRL